MKAYHSCKNILIVTASVLFLVSCSVQKRKYQKGYFVEWNKQKNSLKEETAEHSVLAMKEKSISKTSIQNKIYQENIEPGPSSGYTSSGFISDGQLGSFSNKVDTCDIIRFKDSSELSCKVFEINQTHIKYILCDESNRQIKSVGKERVFKITYRIGTSEIIRYHKPEKQKKIKKKHEPFSILSSFLGPVSFGSLAMSGFLIVFVNFSLFLFIPSVVLAILAIITAKAGEKRVNKDQDKYMGLKQARVGIVFGVLTILALAVILSIALTI